MKRKSDKHDLVYVGQSVEYGGYAVQKRWKCKKCLKKFPKKAIGEHTRCKG